MLGYSAQLQRKLVYFIVVINLLLAATAWTWLQHNREEYRDEARRTSDNLAQVLQESLTGRIRQIDLMMVTVINEHQHQSRSGGLNERQLNELLFQQQKQMPEIDSLRITDRDGNVSHGQGIRPGVNLSDRDFFIQARDNRDDRLIVGKPVFARISKKWVIVFARRIPTLDGGFAGIVYINLPLDSLSRTFADLKLGPSGSVSLRDAELGLIARTPEPLPYEKVVGNKTVSSNLRDMVAAGRVSGSYIARTSHDQVERAAAFRKLVPYPLYVAVGVAEQDYLENWHKEAIFVSASVAIFMLLTAAMTRLLLRTLKQQETTAAELARNEQELRTIVATEPECVKLLGPDGRLLRMNPAGLAMLDADSDAQVLNQDMASMVDPGYREAFCDLTRRVFAGESGVLEFVITSLKGKRRWLETHATPLRNPAGQIVSLLGVTRDITARKEAEQELAHLAQTDMLTGLANRRHFLSLAEQELARAARYGSELSLLMVDIDHFKTVNDTYGHQTGDLVLEKFGMICRQTLRDIDIVGRLGGEEFAILLPQTAIQQAMEAAERLRQACEASAISLEHGMPLHFAISIGVASLAGSCTNLDTLLGLADQSLYEAKRAGRNRVCAHAG